MCVCVGGGHHSPILREIQRATHRPTHAHMHMNVKQSHEWNHDFHAAHIGMHRLLWTGAPWSRKKSWGRFTDAKVHAGRRGEPPRRWRDCFGIRVEQRLCVGESRFLFASSVLGNRLSGLAICWTGRDWVFKLKISQILCKRSTYSWATPLTFISLPWIQFLMKGRMSIDHLVVVFIPRRIETAAASKKQLKRKYEVGI